MGGDLFDDRFRRLLIFRGGIGPLAAGMHRVPRRALVDPGFRTVAVLAQAVADLRFRIPDRLEEVDEVVLRQFLEARLHDQEAALEVVDVERGDSFADAARVLVEPGRQLGALADSVLGGLVVRIGLADVDRVGPCPSAARKGRSRRGSRWRRRRRRRTRGSSLAGAWFRPPGSARRRGRRCWGRWGRRWIRDAAPGRACS